MREHYSVSNNPKNVSSVGLDVSNNVSNMNLPVSNETRLQRWRSGNREKYNEYMRDYMRRKRASV